MVALVGVTLWRAILPLLLADDEERRRAAAIKCPGLQSLTIHGARIFVLPNPSGRNANFTLCRNAAKPSEAFGASRLRLHSPKGLD